MQIAVIYRLYSPFLDYTHPCSWFSGSSRSPGSHEKGVHGTRWIDVWLAEWRFRVRLVRVISDILDKFRDSWLTRVYSTSWLRRNGPRCCTFWLLRICKVIRRRGRAETCFYITISSTGRTSKRKRESSLIIFGLLNDRQETVNIIDAVQSKNFSKNSTLQIERVPMILHGKSRRAHCVHMAITFTIGTGNRIQWKNLELQTHREVEEKQRTKRPFPNI